MHPHAVRFAVAGALAFGGLNLAFAQPAPDPIEGIWTGTITAPQGDVADLGLEFFRTKKGTLIFRMNFPAMFTYGATFGIPVVADGHGGYAITPAFDVSLQLKGDSL